MTSARYRWIAALLTIGASIPPAHETGAQQATRTASYQVQLVGARPGRFTVRATLPSDGAELRMAASRPGDVPEVADAGWPALVHGLTVRDAAGKAVAVAGDGPRGWKLARAVRGPLSLTYEVDLAPLAARGWPAPREAAFADIGHRIVIGRALFITTPAQGAGRVQFTAPPGWQAVVPWPGSTAASAADLTENLVAFVRNAPDVVTAGGFNLKVVGLGRWEPARAEVRQVLGTALRQLVAFIGVAGRADYLVVLLPQGERGGESFRASFAFTYDSAPSAANRGDWGHTIAHELFHYWNGWRLRGADYQATQWFQEGFTDYAADLALVSGGLSTPDEFRARLAAHASEARKLTTPLDAPGSHKGPPLYGAGALVAFIWDTRIRAATNGAHGVGDMFRELWRSTGEGSRPYAWADIQAALDKTASGDWAAFERRYIHGTEPLPLDEALAQIGLVSPGGAAADTMPGAVVQRFVDAFNARDARAMAALVAPAAVVARFPAGGVIMQGRDSIEAFYRRRFAANAVATRITVDPRILEGMLVIDQEHFTRPPGVPGHSTWLYEVRNGLIQRAWMLDGRPASGATGQ